MTTYKVKFHGRENGSIGACHEITKNIEAAHSTEAELKIYETHEHIHVISIVRQD